MFLLLGRCAENRGTQKVTIDPTNVVQSLVFTLVDVLDATRDLYITLRNKEERDRERDFRERGYCDVRSPEYAEDDSDECIVLDKAALTRQFEIGVDEIGPQFAIGDGMLALDRCLVTGMTDPLLTQLSPRLHCRLRS